MCSMCDLNYRGNDMIELSTLRFFPINYEQIISLSDIIIDITTLINISYITS